MMDIEIYAKGLCHCSVCTNIADVGWLESRVNEAYPTGLDHGWKVSESGTFITGEANPHPCERAPELRRHYLMVC